MVQQVAHAKPTLTPSAIEQVLDEHLHGMSAAEPGLVVGISCGGKRLTKAVGCLNIATGAPLRPSTPMRIASLSKQFTAFAYVRMLQQGLIRPIDMIGEHLAWASETVARCSVSDLLTHTSGLIDSFDVGWILAGHTEHVSSATIASLYRLSNVALFSPGERFQYSNAGYLLATLTMEAMINSPLESILDDLAFAPLGLKSTFLKRDPSGDSDDIAARYVSLPKGGFARAQFGTELAGEGGIVSTLDDLLLWVEQIHPNRGSFCSEFRMMAAPVRLTSGLEANYGLGLMLGIFSGYPTLYHSGFLPGTTSYLAKIPALDLGLVVVTNRQDVSAIDLGESIVRRILQIPEAPNLTPICGGLFRSRSTERIVQLTKDRRGQRVVLNGASLGAKRLSNAVLQPNRHDWSISTAALPDGAISLIELGTVDELRWMPHDMRPAAILGAYSNPIAKIEITGSPDTGELTASTSTLFGEGELKLRNLTGHYWAVCGASDINLGGIISFKQDNKSLTMSSLRTAGVKFENVQ